MISFLISSWAIMVSIRDGSRVLSSGCLMSAEYALSKLEMDKYARKAEPSKLVV